jgi:hypothetical protein
MRNNCARTNHRSVSDRHTFENRGPRPDPNVITDMDWPVFETSRRRRVLVGVHDQNVPPDHAAHADGDLLPGDDLGVSVEVRTGSYAQPSPAADLESHARIKQAVSSFEDSTEISDTHQG